MNNPTTTPPTAADLLAEWNYYQKINPIDRVEEKWVQACADVAAQLDQMCEDAGIRLEGSKFVYYLGEVGDGMVGQPRYFIPKLPATEDQALREWLLIRDK